MVGDASCSLVCGANQRALLITTGLYCLQFAANQVLQRWPHPTRTMEMIATNEKMTTIPNLHLHPHIYIYISISPHPHLHLYHHIYIYTSTHLHASVALSVAVPLVSRPLPHPLPLSHLHLHLHIYTSGPSKMHCVTFHHCGLRILPHLPYDAYTQDCKPCA